MLGDKVIFKKYQFGQCKSEAAGIEPFEKELLIQTARAYEFGAARDLMLKDKTAFRFTDGKLK